MNINNNGEHPIYPTWLTKNGTNSYTALKEGQKTGYEAHVGGLTKREYFASKALQGLLSIFDDNTQSPIVPNDANTKYMAELSVKAADYLLEALQK